MNETESTDPMCTCKKCSYRWRSRIQKPVECPRCKSRIDTPYATRKINNKEKKHETEPKE